MCVCWNFPDQNALREIRAVGDSQLEGLRSLYAELESDSWQADSYVRRTPGFYHINLGDDPTGERPRPGFCDKCAAKIDMAPLSSLPESCVPCKLNIAKRRNNKMSLEQGYKFHYQPPVDTLARVLPQIVREFRLNNFSFKITRHEYVNLTYTNPPLLNYDPFHGVSGEFASNLFGKLLTIYDPDPHDLLIIDEILEEATRTSTIWGVAPPWDCVVEHGARGLSFRYGLNRAETLYSSMDAIIKVTNEMENRCWVSSTNEHGQKVSFEAPTPENGGDGLIHVGGREFTCAVERDFRVSDPSERFAELKMTYMKARKCACRPDFVIWLPDMPSYMEMSCPNVRLLDTRVEARKRNINAKSKISDALAWADKEQDRANVASRRGLHYAFRYWRRLYNLDGPSDEWLAR